MVDVDLKDGSYLPSYLCSFPQIASLFFASNKCVYVSMQVSRRSANETNEQAMEFSHKQPVCVAFWQKSHRDKHTFMSLFI